MNIFHGNGIISAFKKDRLLQNQLLKGTKLMLDSHWRAASKF
jgi:hypothetical protein